MIETLFNTNRNDRTRIKNSFGWVVTFRDFPAGSYQTTESDNLAKHALSLYTKGCGEFYCDGKRLADRVPGTLSSEHPEDWCGTNYKTVFNVPTTRLCIPAELNNWKLPTFKMYLLEQGESRLVEAGGKFLLCLGSVDVNNKVFKEEQSFTNANEAFVTALEKVILLEYV